MIESQPHETAITLIQDILGRLGHESYLEEQVSTTEHLLQAAWMAEQAGEDKATIIATLLHDIGHYTSEFDDEYINIGVDNLHEIAGEKILSQWFPPAVTEPIRWHVDAKRYLCAIEPCYVSKLSDASIRTLEFQGGPMNTQEVAQFSAKPMLNTILRVRRYDDGAKVPGRKTPPLEHYLDMAKAVMEKSGRQKRD